MMCLPLPSRHIYEAINPGKFDNVRHYELQGVFGGENKLYEMINISRDRKFSNAKNVQYWLKGKGKLDQFWGHCITGLKTTKTPFVFFGDIPQHENGRIKPKDLLIFRFSNKAEKVYIDAYSDYYTEKKEILGKLISRLF